MPRKPIGIFKVCKSNIIHIFQMCSITPLRIKIPKYLDQFLRRLSIN